MKAAIVERAKASFLFKEWSNTLLRIGDLLINTVQIERMKVLKFGLMNCWREVTDFLQSIMTLKDWNLIE
jgi:hypothetical protein